MLGGGNLSITTMPYRMSARSNEIQRLRSWIVGGNTLLIMAGLADTPEWIMDGRHSISALEQLQEAQVLSSRR